jgi:hypothetical protein
MTMVDRSDCRPVSFARAIREDICTTVAITSAWIAMLQTDGGAYEQLTQHGSLVHHGYRLCVPLALVVEPGELAVH